MTKVCSKCKLVLDIKSFSKDCTKKDGLTSSCKSCLRKLKVKYYHSHKEECKLKVKEYYDLNREHCLNRSKEWSKSHPQSNRASKKKQRDNMPNGVKCSSLRLSLTKRGITFDKSLELHHFSYLNPVTVIVMLKEAHRKMHKTLKLDKTKWCFNVKDSSLLIDDAESALKYARTFDPTATLFNAE